MFRRLMATLLILSLAMPLPAQAAMIATDSIATQGVSSLLDRDDVQSQLRAYGVRVEDAKARIAALSDAEAADLTARIDSLPAGGESVLGVILIVFLVLLLTDILGYTKVFPFTKPMK